MRPKRSLLKLPMAPKRVLTKNESADAIPDVAVGAVMTGPKGSKSEGDEFNAAGEEGDSPNERI